MAWAPDLGHEWSKHYFSERHCRICKILYYEWGRHRLLTVCPGEGLMFESVGALRYTATREEGSPRWGTSASLSAPLGYRVVVEVEPDLGAYYRSLIPKHMPTQRTRWPTHITVVRPFKEEPKSLESWSKYEGELVTFSYDPEVRIDRTYYWLNVWCDRLVEIREELGLPPKSRWTLPPSGGHQCFHTTIANKKVN